MSDNKNTLRKSIAKPSVRENLDAPQVSATHYGHSYNTKQRLASYWHQIDEVLQFRAQQVLEIGVGSGFTTNELRKEGVSVTTLDVAEDLGPDLLGSVRAIPLPDQSVEVSLCCQVLEHLPYCEFPNALRELIRVASKGVILSLPDVERYIRISISTSGRLVQPILKDIPRRPHHRPIEVDPEHYWEIGCRDIVLASVEKVILEVTGSMPKTYRVFENPYHRFFVINK